jgi:hypothetical protein
MNSTLKENEQHPSHDTKAHPKTYVNELGGTVQRIYIQYQPHTISKKSQKR